MVGHNVASASFSDYSPGLEVQVILAYLCKLVAFLLSKSQFPRSNVFTHFPSYVYVGVKKSILNLPLRWIFYP